jgi:hypothetical protein
VEINKTGYRIFTPALLVVIFYLTEHEIWTMSVPEIEQGLSDAAESKVTISFTPNLICMVSTWALRNTDTSENSCTGIWYYIRYGYFRKRILGVSGILTFLNNKK